jgi:WD40 repeat protein
LNRVVALKMILAGQLDSEAEVNRFRTVAENADGLYHPNIVPIYEVGAHDGQHFFSMKLIDGRNLSQRVSALTADPQATARLIATVARAVHHAHQRGVLHRDLKPSNILIDREGQPHVADFGLAKQIEGVSGLTLSGTVVGTPSYMAPEQAAGQHTNLTTAADTYALGAILYECLTGRPPFRAGTPLQTLTQVQHDEPEPLRKSRPSVPRDLEVVCLKCLRKDPGGRYSSSEALADELDRWLAGKPIAARPSGAGELAIKWILRHPAPAALAAVSALAILALVGVLVGYWYNAELKATNVQLESAKTQLQVVNDKLEAASEKLQASLVAVRAEKAKTQRYFYASQMTLIERARQENQIGRVVQLLRSVIPNDPDEEDLRDWEWHHLWRQYCGEQSRLRGHKGPVTAVSFSPDDRLIASGSTDSTIKLWDAVSGKHVRALVGHAGGVTALDFSPDGKRLATASADQTVRLWNTVTGEQLLRVESHHGAVTTVAFSPDGRHLASGGEDGIVSVQEADTGRTCLEFKRHHTPVSGVAFSPDAKTIASTGLAARGGSLQGKGDAFVWDATTGAAHCALGQLRGGWTAVAFSPDGSRLAASGVQGDPLWVWDTVTWKVIDDDPTSTDEARNGSVTRITFSPDGHLLAWSSDNHTIRVYDFTAGKLALTLHDEVAVLSAAFSPDGLRIASGGTDGSVKIWERPGEDPRVLGAPRGRINNVEFSPDGRRVASAGAGKALVWDVISGKSRLLGVTSTWGRVTWSPDGRHIALGRDLKTWELDPGDVQRSLDPNGLPGPQVDALFGAGVAYSRDGKLLAATADRWAVVWDVATGRRLHLLPAVQAKGPPAVAACVAFSPDGKKLAVGSLTPTIDPGAEQLLGVLQLWDLATERIAVSLEGFPADVCSVAFSPDGKWLAAAVWDPVSDAANPGEVRVWDAASGRRIYGLRCDPVRAYAVTFSPNGTRLVAAGRAWKGRDSDAGAVEIWDMSTGQQVATLHGNLCTQYGVAFSQDGRRLATGGIDGRVRIWDGTPIAEAPARDPGN